MTKLNIDISFREELHLVRHLTDCDKAGGNKAVGGKKKKHTERVKLHLT